MITVRTPLEEVAKFLPTKAAMILDGMTPQVQKAAMGHFRDLLMYMEQDEVDLDPIAFETVIGAVVIQYAGIYNAMEHLAQARALENADEQKAKRRWFSW